MLSSPIQFPVLSPHVEHPLVSGSVKKVGLVKGERGFINSIGNSMELYQGVLVGRRGLIIISLFRFFYDSASISIVTWFFLSRSPELQMWP